MADPKTQDSQKVVASAIEKLQPSSGNVEKVSSTSSMEAMYENMAKLFDAFTQGTLMGQGANSDLMLRQVYRSLDKDFLDIIKDSDAVEKIVENIKAKQENLTPENVDQALVSETTKKIVLNTLNPEECNQMDVVLDFIDEIQTSILQVKINLSREYERQKLAYQKSYEGQQEDLDRLNKVSESQTQDIVETLDVLSEETTTWKDEKLEQLEKLNEKFSLIGQSKDGELLQGLQTFVDHNENLQKLVQPFKKRSMQQYNPQKIVEKIRGEEKVEIVEPTTTETNVTKEETNVVVKEKPTEHKEEQLRKESVQPSPSPKKKEEPKKEPIREPIKEIEKPKPVEKEQPKVQEKPQVQIPPQPSIKEENPRVEEQKPVEVVEKKLEPIVEEAVVEEKVVEETTVEEHVEEVVVVQKPEEKKPEDKKPQKQPEKPQSQNKPQEQSTDKPVDNANEPIVPEQKKPETAEKEPEQEQSTDENTSVEEPVEQTLPPSEEQKPSQEENKVETSKEETQAEDNVKPIEVFEQTKEEFSVQEETSVEVQQPKTEPLIATEAKPVAPIAQSLNIPVPSIPEQKGLDGLNVQESELKKPTSTSVVEEKEPGVQETPQVEKTNKETEKPKTEEQSKPVEDEELGSKTDKLEEPIQQKEQEEIKEAPQEKISELKKEHPKAVEGQSEVSVPSINVPEVPKPETNLQDVKAPLPKPLEEKTIQKPSVEQQVQTPEFKLPKSLESPQSISQVPQLEKTTPQPEKKSIAKPNIIPVKEINNKISPLSENKFGKVGHNLQTKADALLSKESGGKIPVGTFGIKDAKYLTKGLDGDKVKKLYNNDTKTTQEMDRRLQKVVLKKVVDGKIPSPIPIKSELKVEEWWEKKDIQSSKAEHELAKKMPKFLVGKNKDSVLKQQSQNIANEEEKKKNRITLNELQDMDKPQNEKQEPSFRAESSNIASEEKPQEEPSFTKEPKIESTDSKLTPLSKQLTSKIPSDNFNPVPQENKFENIKNRVQGIGGTHEGLGEGIGEDIGGSISEGGMGEGGIGAKLGGFVGGGKGVEDGEGGSKGEENKEEQPTEDALSEPQGNKEGKTQEGQIDDKSQVAPSPEEPSPIQSEQPQAPQGVSNGDEEGGDKSGQGQSKLNVKPSANAKICTCPICGSMHAPGEHTHMQPNQEQEDQKDNEVSDGGENKKEQYKPSEDNNAKEENRSQDKQTDTGDFQNNGSSGGGNGGEENQGNETQGNNKSSDTLTKEGVNSTLGKISENLTNTINSPKFQQSFMIGYSGVQKGIGKQMKKLDKKEDKIRKDLENTQDGINNLQSQNQRRPFSFLGALFNPQRWISIGFFVLGALVLIALIRMAINSWMKAYMPPTKGTGTKIMGVTIPGWDQLKAFGIGIYNFVRFGLANWIDRLKLFVYNIKKQLVGKNGCLKNAERAKNTMRRILGAIIIAQTKQVGGFIFKLIFTALSFIPFVGPFFAFLAEFGPLIYAFVTTQLMLMWSKSKEKEEAQAKLDLAGQKMRSKSEVKKLEGRMKLFGSNVKIFKGQMAAIPGLMTSKRDGSTPPKYGAIMRHVPLKTNANQTVAQRIQNKEVKDQMKQNEEKDKATVANYHTTKGIALAHMTLGGRGKAALEEWDKNKELRERYKREHGTWTQWGAKEYYIADVKKKLIEDMMEQFAPEILKLDKYIEALRKSDRFKNVKGPLYDVEKGWNPGYRVFQSDLMSIIPLNPFEEIHNDRDVPIGKPADEEANSIGYMPFTWKGGKNEAVISVHPINFEIERAMAIRKLYSWAAQKGAEVMFNSSWLAGVDDTSGMDFLNIIRKEGYEIWRQWNYPEADRESGFEYHNPRNVLYGDKFVQFINKFNDNKITFEENNAAAATGDKGLVVEVAKEASKKLSASPTVVSKGWWGSRKAAQIENYFNYDKGAPEEEEEEDVPWYRIDKKVVNAAKRVVAPAVRLVENKARFNKWTDTEYFGLKYGAIRDFMMDGGILSMFDEPQVTDPIGKSIPIIQWFADNKLFDAPPAAEGSNALHTLMWNFFDHAGITGYEWKKVEQDKRVQAAFAQSLLEHFVFNVIPQWDAVEKLLSDDITYKTDKTETAMYKGLLKLHALFTRGTILNFLQEHLRFPNMRVHLIGLSNATGDERMVILSFMRKLGIPTFDQKQKILKGWQDAWGNIGKMEDKTLEDKINEVNAMLSKAHYEAKYTGDYSYFKQLGNIYDRLLKEKDNRITAQREARKKKKGGTIVTKPGQVVNVMEPPPKTMLEMEEERKKKEAEEAKKKMEEERKKKEEDEKRLKEEAKRREEIAIAEAKIKAMEAIRKQEENYERILEKMVSTPDKVTDAELKYLGKEVDNLKQEAENRIATLPREERELKLALIRGDKISAKTFKEIKDTAVGLHGSLQEYMDEVNKIPVGNVMAINNAGGGGEQPIQMQDPDSVDLGD